MTSLTRSEAVAGQMPPFDRAGSDLKSLLVMDRCQRFAEPVSDQFAESAIEYGLSHRVW